MAPTPPPPSTPARPIAAAASHESSPLSSVPPTPEVSAAKTPRALRPKATKVAKARAYQHLFLSAACGGRSRRADPRNVPADIRQVAIEVILDVPPGLEYIKWPEAIKVSIPGEEDSEEEEESEEEDSEEEEEDSEEEGDDEESQEE
ncbi:hypothetical protein FN846DRAFT_1023586 [Sphaerosporella brunnea]|uniref:Uncharacterized protein n=1 Tax=Sphaerosporella brunnea TaxID=1250544 RepID=A0A5J5EN48_9PEZI|nr:hypothetical protein FN846DRAFT_1023586 [Sphaerosporella brunnea]